MPDDTHPPAHERNRIDMLHQQDVHFWCRTLDVSPAQLRAAVQQVGPQADAVRRWLESHGHTKGDVKT